MRRPSGSGQHKGVFVLRQSRLSDVILYVVQCFIGFLHEPILGFQRESNGHGSLNRASDTCHEVDETVAAWEHGQSMASLKDLPLLVVVAVAGPQLHWCTVGDVAVGKIHA